MEVTRSPQYSATSPTYDPNWQAKQPSAPPPIALSSISDNNLPPPLAEPPHLMETDIKGPKKRKRDSEFARDVKRDAVRRSTRDKTAKRKKVERSDKQSVEDKTVEQRVETKYEPVQSAWDKPLKRGESPKLVWVKLWTGQEPVKYQTENLPNHLTNWGIGPFTFAVRRGDGIIDPAPFEDESKSREVGFPIMIAVKNNAVNIKRAEDIKKLVMEGHTARAFISHDFTFLKFGRKVKDEVDVMIKDSRKVYNQTGELIKDKPLDLDKMKAMMTDDALNEWTMRERNLLQTEMAKYVESHVFEGLMYGVTPLKPPVVSQ